MIRVRSVTHDSIHKLLHLIMIMHISKPFQLRINYTPFQLGIMIIHISKLLVNHFQLGIISGLNPKEPKEA
jgi:hypothetical protein